MENNKIFEFMSEIGKHGFDAEKFKEQMEEVRKNSTYHKIGLVNKSDNEDPKIETEGSAGFDLRANLEYSVVLKKNSRKIIPTGLFFEIPTGYEIQIRPRSGLAAKHGITVLNSPGTIDSDYRGEIQVILINHGDENFVINHGERIAQGVLAFSIQPTFFKKNEIDENTSRGVNGFGSTGVK